MRDKRNRRLTQTLVLGIAGYATVAISPAQAQSTMGRLPHPVVQQPDDQTKKQDLPPAVPGSKPDAAAAAPAGTPAADMSPTDALFDAINRGDLNGAKDAISRGADLDGHNVLGMTPMDLSVDLGRNDISFLLLSLRGSDIMPLPATATAQPAPAAKPARPRPVTPVRDAAAVPAAPKRAELFAGNGGAAVPQAGFLGFGGSRAP